MATDPKLDPKFDPQSQPPPTPAAKIPGHRDKGVKIFTYPKVIFIFPTMIAAFICAAWMYFGKVPLVDPGRSVEVVQAGTPDKTVTKTEKTTTTKTGTRKTVATTEADAEKAVIMQRFTSTQNLLAMGFLLVFGFNMLVMAMDFPRFTVLAGIVLIAFLTFFILWLGMFFQLDLVRPFTSFLERIYAAASPGFYFMIGLILLVIFTVIYISRWLDFWEILPNEILHHHGPLSDLERYPTFNLKFDKEIPDLLEFLFLGSGRLVLHVANERKSIVLDNVLWINTKEDELKKMMSRMDVRVTTDQEIAD